MPICRFCNTNCYVVIPPTAPLALVTKLPRRQTHLAGCDAGQEWEMSKFDVCLSVINEAINAAAAEEGTTNYVQNSDDVTEVISPAGAVSEGESNTDAAGGISAD